MKDNTFWLPTILAIASLGWNYFQARKIVDLNTLSETKRLIHKCQFEKEFAIYTELWRCLVDLRNATALLRPIVERVDPTLSEAQRRQAKLEQFVKAFNTVVNIFEHNRPFYSVDIYLVVKQLLEISSHEQVDFIHLSEELNKEYWDNGVKNATAIKGYIDQIEQLIRRRIEVIQVA